MLVFLYHMLGFLGIVLYLTGALFYVNKWSNSYEAEKLKKAEGKLIYNSVGVFISIFFVIFYIPYTFWILLRKLTD